MVGLAILTQALVLVSVLAPNALSIDAYWIDRTSPVPKLEFINIPTSGDATWWLNTLQNYVRNGPSGDWVVPPECGSSCTFQMTYQAPGVTCQYMAEQETVLRSLDSQLLGINSWWWAYNSTPNEFEWGASDPYLTFAFVPVNAQIFTDETQASITQTGPVQGQLCKFYDATYRASFTYKDNQKTIGVEAISNTNEISANCPWKNGDSTSQVCTQYASVAAKLAYEYQFIFAGRLGFSSNKYDYTVLDLISQFIDYKYSPNDEVQAVSLAPYPNTSQRVEHAFSTTALGLLLWMNQTESGSVRVEVGSSWLFDPLELWVIYGSALLLSLVAGLYGLHLARVGDILREKKFSSFLIATRTNDLDEVCVQNYDTIMSTKLRHDAETGRFVVSKNEINDETPHNRAPGHAALDETTTQGWTRLIMIISLLLALGFVLGHHFYLKYLHGRDADRDRYPQYWIKGASNAFSQAVSICLGTAAAYSLTQASWRVFKLHGGSVETIDNLFGLPSPLSVVSLVKESRQIQITYLIIIAVAIQGLGLVTTFAPNALTVDDSPPSTSKDLSVPTMNLSVVQYSRSLEGTWTGLLQDVEAKPPESSWLVPPGCGAACSFKVQYDAPALSCRDIQLNESLVAPYDAGTSYPGYIWQFYTIDDSLFRSSEWSDNNPEVILSYIPMSYNLDNHSMTSYGSPTGSACRCRDGRYELEFKYANHAIDLTTTLLPYSNAFPTNCMELDSEVAINACHTYRNNTPRQFREEFIGLSKAFRYQCPLEPR
ncbi:hypothetical protein CPB86DRAFT_184000 [Serendipita vermifera]|nr:hypothetical protein CPB86DRAFT_184000 [Serendipita vermifera]